MNTLITPEAQHAIIVAEKELALHFNPETTLRKVRDYLQGPIMETLSCAFYGPKWIALKNDYDKIDKYVRELTDTESSESYTEDQVVALIAIYNLSEVEPVKQTIAKLLYKRAVEGQLMYKTGLAKLVFSEEFQTRLAVSMAEPEPTEPTVEPVPDEPTVELSDCGKYWEDVVTHNKWEVHRYNKEQAEHWSKRTGQMTNCINYEEGTVELEVDEPEPPPTPKPTVEPTVDEPEPEPEPEPTEPIVWRTDCGKYWKDKDRNHWDYKHFTQEEAVAHSKSLTNCKNCANCCDCIDCIDCIHCDDCRNCNGCSYCCSSTNCVRCKSCHDCTDCTDCDNLVDECDCKHKRNDADDTLTITVGDE